MSLGKVLNNDQAPSITSIIHLIISIKIKERVLEFETSSGFTQLIGKFNDTKITL